MSEEHVNPFLGLRKTLLQKRAEKIRQFNEAEEEARQHNKKTIEEFLPKGEELLISEIRDIISKITVRGIEDSGDVKFRSDAFLWIEELQLTVDERERVINRVHGVANRVNDWLKKEGFILIFTGLADCKITWQY